MSGFLLAVECATADASVALFRDGVLVGEKSTHEGRHHAETLLGLVDAVLAGGEVGLAAVDAFAVSVGPGAFTSLRVGIASVKGLAFGSSAPVAPVSTLAALAFDVAPERSAGRPVAALLDARRDEVYAALFRGDEEAFPEGVYAVEEMVARLPLDCVLVGSGADCHAAVLRGRGEREFLPDRGPRARSVGALGLQALARGEGVSAPDLQPRYLRRPDAEVQRGARPLA